MIHWRLVSIAIKGATARTSLVSIRHFAFRAIGWDYGRLKIVPKNVNFKFYLLLTLSGGHRVTSTWTSSALIVAGLWVWRKVVASSLDYSFLDINSTAIYFGNWVVAHEITSDMLV